MALEADDTTLIHECGSCAYWKPNNKGVSRTGICRRYPPTGSRHPSGGTSSYPVPVIRDDWCGEWLEGFPRTEVTGEAHLEQAR
jgi:hypothetical protein